ncbi:MAG: outer membrane beta-barrel protein [Pseudomonadota bacterium]
MGNPSKSLVIGALATTLLAGSAFAADLTPPPVIDFEPEYEAEFGGNFYLRGYVGFSNQQVDSVDNAIYSDPAVFDVDILNSEFEAGGVFGGAVGYRLNQWFRADVSAEYRMRTGYSQLDRYSGAAGGVPTNSNYITANKSEFLFLANAFVDLGTYYKLTPYIGAGVGATYTEISGFSDLNVPNAGVAYAEDNGDWEFAWALHAGLAYQVTDHFAVELGYRYLNLGDAESGDIISFDGTNVIDNPLQFNELTSHDLHLGMRWEFGGSDYLGY